MLRPSFLRRPATGRGPIHLLAAAALAFAFAAGPAVAAERAVVERALAWEADLQGQPERAVAGLRPLLPEADAADPAARAVVYALAGQALVQSGDHRAATDLAARLEGADDPAVRAAGLLVASAVESSVGEAAKATAHADAARDLLAGSGHRHLRTWAALAHGQAARLRGQSEEALGSLQEALSLADADDHPLRRANALYQLSVLHWNLRNAQEALDSALASYQQAERARNAYAMANARMAESGAMQLLERPARELASMQEALAIARAARSRTAEARTLVNLADLRLRRKQFADAMRLSRESLALAEATGDPSLASTSRANLGFALIGLGRLAEGKRYADEAMAEYERVGATAETAELAGEYGRSLEEAGDARGALALYHRERRLLAEIATEARQRILLEVQERFASEKRRREIELLARENALKTAELANQALRQRIGWLVAALLALSFVVVTLLYRKLRASSALLARRNEELAIQSSRDPLTSLYNRRHFQDVIAAEAAGGGAGAARPRALLLIDLDHFKETNDRHGHALGDAVLVEVAARLRDTLRESDTIVRWGGEEFLVLAPAAADRVDEIAARILRAIAGEPLRAGGQAIRTTVSIGYVALPLPPARVPMSWDRALGLVDMAMYMAKTHGRNRAYGLDRLADDDPETVAAAARDLERAWKDGRVEMSVVYGPTPPNGADNGSRPLRVA